jgi:hypothetical protein
MTTKWLKQFSLVMNISGWNSSKLTHKLTSAWFLAAPLFALSMLTNRASSLDYHNMRQQFAVRDRRKCLDHKPSL